MSAVLRLSVFSLTLVASFACGGCERKQEPAGPFNITIGESKHGAPFRVARIDEGILKDASTYSGAAAPKGGPSGAAPGGAGDGESEVRALVLGTFAALLKGDIEVALDNFNAEQVAALKADTSDLHDTHDKFARLMKSVGEKLGQPIDLSKLDGAGLQAMGMGVDLKEIITVQLTTPDAADVGFKMPAGGFPGMPGMPMAPPGGAGGDTPVGAAPAGPKIPVLKQDGKWRIQLPKTITADDVKQMKGGLKAAQIILDKLTEKVDASDAKSPADLQAIVQAAVMEALPEAMAAAQGDAGDAAAPPTDAPVETPPPPPPGRPRSPRDVGGGATP